MAGFGDDATGQDVMYADNVDFSGSTTPTGKFTTDGQILIGSTAAPHIKVGTITAGSGITVTNASGAITIAASGGASVTSVTGTSNRITSTGGTTPVIDISAAYVGQSSITTLGTIATGVWNGTNIPLANGGTNANLTASNGGIFYSSSTAGAILAGTATANQILVSGSSTTPAWSTSTYPVTNAKGDIIYGSATNVLSDLTISTWAGASLIADTQSGIPQYNSPRNYIYLYDEFIAQTFTWGVSTGNGGSSAVQGTPIAGNTAGAANLFTGGANNGFTYFQNQQCLILGNGFLSQTFYCQIPTLSNSTDRFTIFIGLSDGGNNPTDGIWFNYSDNVNSGKWVITTSASSTTTTGSTNSTVDTNWHRYRIDVNAAGSSVSFYIDDVQVANSPLATNIPTVKIGPWLGIQKSAGTNSLNLYIDYFTLFVKLTSAR